MTRKQINTQFVKYTPLLHKLSHQTASRCRRPEEDVFQQACFLFMQATESFNESKGKFGTYLFSRVRNGLSDWGKKNDLPKDPADLPETFTSLTARDNAMFHDWLSGLKEEVHEVAMIILNGPTEVLDIAGTAGRKAVLGALRRHLRKNKGWSWPKIWTVIRETKAAVATLALK